MKKYENPTIDIEKLTLVDIIATSDPGTELPTYDDNDIDWQ